MTAEAAENSSPCFSPEELAIWTGGIWEPHGVMVRGLTQDGRKLLPGAMYVAIRGERFDGHNFVAQAAANGAAAAMVCRDWNGIATIPLLRVDDTRAALILAAAGHRRRFSGFVAGVTGSVGKTTTKELTAAFFRATGSAAATAGNLNNEIGLPLSILSSPHDVARAVFEVGTNHVGEIVPLAKLMSPSVAVVTAVAPVHLEHFGAVDVIANEKADLLRVVPSSGVVALDADGAFFDYLRRQTRARVASVSLLRADADYFGIVINEWDGEVEVVERATGKRSRLVSGLRGRHHATNLLLAIALARAADVPWEILGKSLENMKFPPMRWQQKTVNGFTIVNDAYNASPPSMAGALRTFAVLPGATRRVVVLGDMLELGTAEESLHREIGRMVAQAPCQALVCVGRRAKWIADEAIATGFPAQQVWRYADAATAATDTTAWMRPGDAVLLKASRGMGLERVATALAGAHAGEGDGHGG